MASAVNPDIKNTHAVAQALILAAEEWRDEQNKRKKQQSALSKAPQTEDELWDATYNLTGIRISRHRVCPHHTSPFTAFADAYFARTSMAIWKASRGFGGKTLLLALLGHMEAITLGAEITILGGSGQQSERVHKAQEQFWTYPKSPLGLLAREPTLYETILKNGGHTTALMASTRSARGPHPQRLRLDEIDEMDLLVLDASLGQTMSARGITAQTVMSSTHQYPDGTMTEMYRRAAEHNWKTYEWCVAWDTQVDTPRGPRRICDLRAGDVITTFDQDTQTFVQKRINAAWSNGTKQTLRVVTSDGTVECTKEHRLLTDRGWREARYLTKGTRLLAVPKKTVLTNQDRSLPHLLQATQGTHSNLPRVWGAQGNQSLEDLSEVLQSQVWSVRAAEQQCTDDGARDRTICTQAVFTRGEGRGTPHDTRNRLRDEPRGRQVRMRLLPTKLPCHRRGVRRHAQAGTCIDPRQGTGAGNLGGRVRPLYHPVRPRYAYVVEVTPGRTVDVWDVSVPGTHTFVANGLVVHNCYRENLHTPSNPNGFIDPQEIDRKRSEITMAMWDAEYEGQEPSPESRAIVTQAVEDMFDQQLGTAPGNLNEEYIFEQPLRTAEYVTGADWAKDRDYTIIVTLRVDCTPARVVAYSRDGRKPWPQMVERFNQRVEMYPGKAAHDATGLGDVVDDLLTVDAEGLQLRGRVRSDMLSEYVKAIESHDIRSPRIEFMYAEHKYATLNDLYGTGHLPDNLCAGAMAVYAHKHGVASKAGAFFA
jgi:hypothetical protein